MAKKQTPPRYYMLGEISKLLGIPLVKLMKLQSTGKLPVGIRAGRFHAYPKSDFEEIARQCNKANGRGKSVDGEKFGFRKMDSKRARLIRRSPRVNLEDLLDADDSIAIDDDE